MGPLVLGVLVGSLAGTVRAEQARRAVGVSLGYETHQVQLVDPTLGVTLDASPEEADFRLRGHPVFSILSRIFLSEYSCLGFKSSVRSNRLVDECPLGLGLRFAGGQRRISGNWFPLSTDPNVGTSFYYNSLQANAEVLFGAMIDAFPAIAFGHKIGNNNYDLQVLNGNQVLVNDINKNATYRSNTFYFSFLIISGLIRRFTDVSIVLPIELAVERTLPGENAISVPDINGTGTHDVDLRTTTYRISVEFGF